MTRVLAKRVIKAPAERIFEVVSNVENSPNVDPDVLSVEFLTSSRTGVGTRFRETRRMNNKEMVSELEVTEYDPPQRVRFVTDSHGTVWDTVFTVNPHAEGSELSIDMHCRAHKLLPKLMNPLMKGFFRRGIEKHLVSLQTYCEAPATT